MLYTTRRNVATELTVTLTDASGDSVTGVLYTAVSVEYRKQGAVGFTSKTLLAGEWSEAGDGIYRVTFTASELDTAGFFRYKITGGAFEDYIADVQVIDDYLTTAEQIIAIKEALALKTNITDADTLFSQLEQRMRLAEDSVEDLEQRLNRALAALAAKS